MKVPSIITNNGIKLLSGLANNDDSLTAMIAKDWIGDAATVYTYKKEGGQDDAREKAIEEFQKRPDIENARIYTKDAFVITDEVPQIQGEVQENPPNMGM